MRQVLEREHFEVGVVATSTVPLEERYGIVVNAGLDILESFVKVRATQALNLIQLCQTSAVQGRRDRNPNTAALHEPLQMGRCFSVVLENCRRELLGFRVASFLSQLAQFYFEHFIHGHFVDEVLCRRTNPEDGIDA